jgi:hypothetical protein
MYVSIRFNIVIYIPLPPFGSPHHLPQRIIKITLWNLVIYNPKLLSLLHTLKSSSGQLMCWSFSIVWNMWIFMCQPCVHKLYVNGVIMYMRNYICMCWSIHTQLCKCVLYHIYTIMCKVGYYHGSNISMLNNYFILNIPCIRIFQKIFYFLYKICSFFFFLRTLTVLKMTWLVLMLSWL